MEWLALILVLIVAGVLVHKYKPEWIDKVKSLLPKK